MKVMNNLSTIYIVYEGRLGAGRASSTYVLENAEIFSKFSNVVLIVSRRPNWVIPRNLSDKFEIVELGKQFDPRNRFRNIAGHLRFSFHIRRYLSRQENKTIIIYHSWWPAVLTSILRSKRKQPYSVLEVHDHLKLGLHWRFLFYRNFDLFIATNSIKYKELCEFYSNRTVLERNAVRLERYRNLNVIGEKNHDKFTLGYSGTLGPKKNPKMIGYLAIDQPQISIQLAGPMDSTAKALAAFSSNILLCGLLNIEDVPAFQNKCNALLITLDPKDIDSFQYTSTMKLFEYIASRKPIIAPLVPSILEILDKSEFYGYEADDRVSLSRSVDLLISDSRNGSLRLPGRSSIENIDWEARNRRIIEFIQIQSPGTFNFINIEKNTH